MGSISKPTLVWWIALFLMLATNIGVHSHIVTSFTFNEFDRNPSDLTYQGDVHIPSNTNFLRLTKNGSFGGSTQNSIGRVVYSRLPVMFWSSSPAKHPIFQTTLQFVVTPSKHGAADGLAFFIAPVNSTVGVDGTNFGVFDINGRGPNIFAVEFDTFSWGDSDPDYLHLGIDIESKYSVNTTKFDSGTGELVTATISYDANTKLIRVDASTASQAASLTYTYDLTSILPQLVEVGISASTGGAEDVELYGVFDLVSWSFTSTIVPPATETYIRQSVEAAAPV